MVPNQCSRHQGRLAQELKYFRRRTADKAALALPTRRITMLRLVLIFAVIALIAGAFGFTGIAGASAGIAKIIFTIFLVLLLLAIVGAVLGISAF
jgi:uncharacterized membrane protein YtjA (UPF0391 family)